MEHSGVVEVKKVTAVERRTLTIFGVFKLISLKNRRMVYLNDRPSKIKSSRENFYCHFEFFSKISF